MIRTVFITGVLGGIGAATARVFKEAGWHVAGMDQRPLPGAQTAVDQFLEGDLARADVGESLEKFIGSLDRLDAVVNNAAIQIKKPLHELSVAEWDQLFAANLRSAFLVSRTAYGALARTTGCIVNVASVHAIATSPGMAAYAASKAALVALTRSAALEMAEDGIRVNAVLPGAVDTPRRRLRRQRSRTCDCAPRYGGSPSQKKSLE
jgi:NAD(P)-dependent dehydrogenase (short-subunit alcohol dehydrogenase family)